MEEESRAIVAREIGDLVFVEVVAPRYDARRTNEIETENGRASPAFNLLSLSLSLSTLRFNSSSLLQQVRCFQSFESG